MDSDYDRYDSGDEVCSDGDESLEVTSDDNNDKPKREYVVLSEADVRECRENDISAISSVLSVSKVEAGILLRHCNWTESKVHEEWFADEDTLRKTVGIFTNPVFNNKNATELTCNICFDAFPKDETYVASCGHPFCDSCWEGYITTSINDGPGCLTLRCPEPGCGAAVGQDMVDALVSEDHKKKYASYLVRSYIEDNRKAKWCPAPGCDYALDFVLGSASNYDVICNCKYGFCWNCTEEAHSPVDCETVSKWIVKNSSESENTNWILANTKPCPRCKRPIEKNQGCMHMACRPPCGFRFCWLCLGPLQGHIEACNRFKTGVQNEADKRREMAKKSLARYTHFYERWAANESSREKAVADLEEMKSVHMDKLRDIQGESEGQVTFLENAWLQIVECRRVLKWSYAYGYYLPEEEVGKKRLFEYLQGEAEVGLERLHHCAENELQQHLTAEGPSKDFNEFRAKLLDLTIVTRTYFENLVLALENGLSEVDSQCHSKRRGGGSGSGSSCQQKRYRNTAISRFRGPSTGVIHVDDEDDLDYWLCDRCTYLNSTSTMACQMCNQESCG